MVLTGDGRNEAAEKLFPALTLNISFPFCNQVLFWCGYKRVSAWCSRTEPHVIKYGSRVFKRESFDRTEQKILPGAFGEKFLDRGSEILCALFGQCGCEYSVSGGGVGGHSGGTTVGHSAEA